MSEIEPRCVDSMSEIEIDDVYQITLYMVDEASVDISVSEDVEPRQRMIFRGERIDFLRRILWTKFKNIRTNTMNTKAKEKAKTINSRGICVSYIIPFARYIRPMYTKNESTVR